ncbi:helix-turn-helix domain-containing protein [Rhizobium puerariae]|uniref:Helix-turn-helix domain-containing protein n=1 Tax=Rhizobium puerariae TaxID=1585791 RepID=A0ABV6AEX5_9HYPH
MPLPSDDAYCVVTELVDLPLHRIWKGEDLLAEGERPKGSLEIFDLREEWQCQYLSPFDTVHFQIPFRLLQSFAADMGRPEFSGLLSARCVTDEVVLGLANALIPILNGAWKSNQLFLRQIKLALLTHLTQNYGGLHFPSRRKGTLAPWQERRAVEFLAAHLNAQFSIVELADVCSLSRSYFIKAFKETFGRTPYRWLLEYRVSRAREQLLSDTPIAEIAVSCGFSDQSHLTRVFAEITGQSPGSWRRDNRTV